MPTGTESTPEGRKIIGEIICERRGNETYVVIEARFLARFLAGIISPIDWKRVAIELAHDWHEEDPQLENQLERVILKVVPPLWDIRLES